MSNTSTTSVKTEIHPPAVAGPSALPLLGAGRWLVHIDVGDGHFEVHAPATEVEAVLDGIVQMFPRLHLSHWTIRPSNGTDAVMIIGHCAADSAPTPRFVATIVGSEQTEPEALTS